MIFPPLALAMIVSLWLVDPESRRETKFLAAAATILLMLPNPSTKFWATPMGTPQFFTDGSAQYRLSRKDVVMTLPWEGDGRSMDWQAECDLCFRNVSGWTGTERFEVRRWPIANYLGGSKDLPEPELQLAAFLANNQVTAIIVDDSDPRADEWNRLIATTGLTRKAISGVSLYEVEPHALKDFKGLTGLAMERRATELRFATLLSAADEYLAAGHPPEEISPARLVDLGFLPATWKRQVNGFYDLLVLPWSNGSIVVGELGSPDALTPLIERYRDTASEIYLPFPRTIGPGSGSFTRRLHNALLPPAAMPIDGPSMEFVGLAFDREQLRDLAARDARPALAAAAAESGKP